MPKGVYKRKVEKLKVVCKQCGKIFGSYLSRNRKYCSNKCSGLSKFGKKRPEKIRKKISNSHIGIRPTEESKRKNKEMHLGKKHSEETKRKIGRMLWKGGIKAILKRRKNSLKWQLNHRITMGILKSLKNRVKNGRTWQSLVGYNVEQLKNRLYSTMPKGYTWRDFMIGKLHIDHIIPVSFFYFEKPEDINFRKCWTLSNLRFLTALENLRKGDKIIRRKIR